MKTLLAKARFDPPQRCGGFFYWRRHKSRLPRISINTIRCRYKYLIRCDC